MRRCGTCKHFDPWAPANYKPKVGDGMSERIRAGGKFKLSLFGQCRAPLPDCLAAFGCRDAKIAIETVSAFKHPNCTAWSKA